MKASVIISKLQRIVEKHGDMDVCISYEHEIVENIQSVTFEDLAREFEDAKEEENYICISVE